MLHSGEGHLISQLCRDLAAMPFSARNRAEWSRLIILLPFSDLGHPALEAKDAEGRKPWMRDAVP